MNTTINKVAELMQSNHDLRDEIDRMIKEREETETKMFNLTLENENLASKVEEYEAVIYKGSLSPGGSPRKQEKSLQLADSPMRRRSTNKPNIRSDFFSSEDSNDNNDME